jgi:predicted DNA-binding transcriptional regulator AlpA
MNDTNRPQLEPPPPSLMREGELASRWRISVKTLQNMRVSGEGPAFVKLGRAVRYAASDVIAYERERTGRSTSVHHHGNKRSVTLHIRRETEL